MPGSGLFLIDAGTPAGVLQFSSTKNSKVIANPDGSAILYGEISATLLSQPPAIVSIAAADSLHLGPSNPSSGTRALLSATAITVKSTGQCRGVDHGPTLYFGHWTFEKKAGQAIAVEFAYQTIYVCDQPMGLLSKHRMMLLLPGEKHDPPHDWAWKFADERGRLIKAGSDGYCVETNTRLYDSEPTPDHGAVVTFPPPRAIPGNRVMITADLNVHREKKVRLRYFVTDNGVPVGLQIDSPGMRMADCQLRLSVPDEWGIGLQSQTLGTSMVPLERAWFSRGMCELDIDRDDRVQFSLGPCATLAGNGGRFRFQSRLVVGTHDTRATRNVEFVERKPPANPTATDEVFDGLRLLGFNSTGRSREVLDVSQPRLAMLAERGFDDEPTTPLVQLTVSWLGPRQRQLSHDAIAGVLDVPLPRTMLRVRRQPEGLNSTVTPLRYELQRRSTLNWYGTLTFASCELLVPPLGSLASLAQKDKGTVSTWNKYLVKTLSSGKEFQGTHSSAQPDLRLQEDWFRNWALKTTEGFILHEQAELGSTFAAVEFQRSDTVTKALADNDNTGLAYGALAVVLAYVAAEYRGQGWKSFFHRKLSIFLNKDAIDKWAKKHKELENLVFSLDQLASNADQQAWFASFVHENVKIANGSEPVARALWPFSPGLGIPLYEGADPSAALWLWDVKRNGKTCACQFVFDYSTRETLDPTRVGPYSTFLKEEPQKLPRLWPRSRTVAPGTLPGSALDPAFNRWQGVFLADVPLVLAVDIPDGALLLQSLSDTINKGLVLEYGWLDATGHTWKVKLKGAGKTQVYPRPSLNRPPYALYLWDFTTIGSAGTMIAASLTMSVEIDAIKSDDGNPIELCGKGTLGLTDGQSSEFEITPATDSKISTKSLPGFKRIDFRRFRTDFRTASLEVDLVPSDELKRTLPWFDQDRIQAALSLPISADSPTPTLSVLLPAEAPSRLFEKWPISVRGFSFKFGTDASLNETEVTFALDVGALGLKRVGGRLIVTSKGSSLLYRVELDNIDFDLSILGLRLEGQLSWRDGNHQAGDKPPIDPVQYNDANNRDFYGAATLSGFADGGAAGLYLRISSGARPFWIASLKKETTPKVAGTDVTQAGLLVAYGAQRILEVGQKPLSDYLTAPESLDRSLFPASGKDPVEWLQKWSPATDGMGVVVGIQGTFEPDSFLAKAIGNDNLALLWSDSGLFYGQTNVSIFSMVSATIRLLIDFEHQYANASVQLPSATLENTANLSPGLLSISFGWGKTQGFGLSMGYPPMLPGTIGSEKPDWSKAISVQLPDAWPINTFQGGVKAYYFDSPTDGVSFGFGLAIRAGYSNSFQVTGNDIADARAYVEVMIGGTFNFCKLNTAPSLFSLPLFVPAALSNDEKWLLETVNELLARRKSTDRFLIGAAIYGDVKGHASVIFLDVTIAGVRIDASAMFEVLGELGEGITRMRAEFIFEVRVEIGCDTYSTSAVFDVVMINRGGGTPAQCNKLLQKFRDRAIDFHEEAL
ncbi:hypothetical protein CBA19CS22_39485 [Caballeronia novacaledonica]|uniref:Uncharacterized protein n=1 Tax=Caballeronia novacaledonica TaxID=1544861 RepID=A0ACB5R5S9_9BURK|nr:hypothetical protein [Caballeronia sp. LZ029]MDR5749053.1 hypothetical protein [Caballeronia sp. LZ029]GJH22761.1 hypothetical protein CBA19CS22_39485 [Caballeronia novacaledonica]